MESMERNPENRKPCPACGMELPPQVDANRCPRCLLRAAMESEGAAEEETVADFMPGTAGEFPKTGEVFGHYRIIRFLGKGGMGAAFEAEDLQSGRPVALKVLGHRLDSPEARRRFLREGRLAASVNHPNSVYVFGTEEIAGVPVISMELMTGGNLQELVAGQGPLPVPQAVDFLLQIVAGLEAAHQAGILHRDIKPSNCFINSDGTVKIGDFGLSVSKTLNYDSAVTVTGAFVGTPAFASPEQLRGDELTVRSDIYSVGVTLYYLLTGRYPFEGGDLVRLLASVLEQRPVSPIKWRPDLPAELARVLLQCLEKNPDHRFSNYEALRLALQPFASASLTPAALSLRFLAGCIDSLVLMTPALVVNDLMFGPFTGGTGAGPNEPSPSSAEWLGNYGIALAYYGLLEGCWGASVGKALCGLRVFRSNGTSPGIVRILGRAIIFLVPSLLLVWLKQEMLTPGNAISNKAWFVFVIAPLMVMAIRFSTARRRNQFGGLHDLASDTRVLVKSAYANRPVQPVPENDPAELGTTLLIGPYHLLERLGGSGGEDLFRGFDPQLLRRVWIRRISPGSLPVSSARRQLGRPGRLRWLQGKRTENEAWDVYDAVQGRPLLTLLGQKQSWSQVRYWLFDLADELRLAAQDNTLPAVLNLDRIWITAEGRAKLLEFAAPGSGAACKAPPSPGSPGLEEQLVFLKQVAISSLEGSAASKEDARKADARAPLARHARHFLESLGSQSGLADVLATLKPLLNQSCEISRAQRLALLASTWFLSLPVLAIISLVFGYAILAAMLNVSPEVATLRHLLYRLEDLRHYESATGSRELEERQATEIYIAGRFSPWLAAKSHGRRVQLLIPERLRREAARIGKDRPIPSEEQLAWARQRVEPGLETLKKPGSGAHMAQASGIPLPLWIWGGYISVILLLILPCLAGSCLFRGGLVVRLWGIQFVTSQGKVAPRWRVVARNGISWLPFILLLPGWLWLSPWLGETVAILTLAGVGTAIAVASACLPQRGWPDRLAGLWPVPR